MIVSSRFQELGFCVHVKHPHKVSVTSYLFCAGMKIQSPLLMQKIFHFMLIIYIGFFCFQFVLSGLVRISRRKNRITHAHTYL